MRLRKYGLLSSILTLALLASCGSQKEVEQTVSKTAVQTAPVIQKTLSFPVHTSGRLSPKNEAKLSFKIGGIIDHIYVRAGETVQKGQTLARLKPDEIDAQVNQAETAHEKAERDLKRVKNLYADSVATLEQFQNAQSALEVAASNLKIARFNREHAVITAPSDGRVLKRFVDANEMVGSGTPVFYFGSTAQRWVVRCGVTDRDVMQLQLGDSASVTLDALKGSSYPATIGEIAGSADPMSGTFEIEISIQSAPQRLFAGLVAGVDLFPSGKQQYFVIPVEALVEADGKDGFVFTPNRSSGTVTKIPVKVGQILNKQVTIISGLENIPEVVTAGASYLHEGSKIEIKD